MSRSGNGKLKILLLAKFFLSNTDSEHPVTMAEILAYLSSAGIECERKSVYDDIAVLCDSGLEIEKTADNRGYFTESRDFELPELKLLVDAVQSAKFISVKKSGELIAKIERLTDLHRARELQRQVYVINRAKTANESVYYSVDLIHGAIAGNRKISFGYFNYNNKKERVPSRGGAIYTVSPWGLTWDDENYYLVGYDSSASMIKHYRVDKMTGLSLSDEEREGGDAFSRFDMALYSKKMFGMFGGTEKNVTLRCDGSLAGAVVDRFGLDVPMLPDGDGFTASVRVVESPVFYGWVFGFGQGMKIVSPRETADGFLRYVDSVTKLYREE